MPTRTDLPFLASLAAYAAAWAGIIYAALEMAS